jgi:hypothetical protein
MELRRSVERLKYHRQAEQFWQKKVTEATAE